MPASLASGQMAAEEGSVDPLSVPHPLPVTIENVRVVRGDVTTSAGSLVVNEHNVSWNEGSIPGSAIVLHGIVSDEEPKCVYAQLEDTNEVRFIASEMGTIGVIYRALSSLAIVAEQAVQAEESDDENDGFYTRRADGTFGTVSIDTLLASNSGMERYEDAEESEKEENGKS